MALTKIPTHMLFSGAASEDLSIDADTLYIDSSTNRVGIANNSPSVALDVTGAAKISSTLDLTSHLDMPDSANIKLGASDDLQLWHSGSHSFIDASGTGNLYIRTDALKIKNGDSDETYITADNDGAVVLYYDNSAKLNTASGGVTITGTATTNSGGGNAVLGSHLDLGDSQKVRLGAGDDLQLYHDGSNSFIKNATGDLYIDTVSGTIHLTKNGTSEVMASFNTDSSVTLRHDNSIKLTTTSGGVDVTGALTASGGVTAGANSDVTVTGSDAYFTVSKSGAASVQLIAGGAGNSRVRANSDLIFDANSSEAMRIQGSSGNVGIGTASPNTLMHLYSDDGVEQGLTITQNTDDSNSGALLRLYNSSATAAMIRFGANHSSKANELFITNVGTNSPMTFATQDTERMRIDSSGNVGIGTSSPSTPLHIKTNSSGYALTLEENSGSEAYQIGIDQYGGLIFYNSGTKAADFSDASTFRLFDSGTIKVNLNQAGDSYFNGGNVGIGTDSPKFKLSLPQATGVTGAIGWQDGSGNKRAAIWCETTNDHLVFATDTTPTERARITDGGAFLVGTTSTTINSSNFGAAIFADGRPKFSKNVTGGSHVMNVFGNAGEFRVYGDGDVQNTNNSYAGISDQSVKENIVDATDKLEDLKQVQIRNYNLIDDDLKQIGVIAQELEPIFPGLIKECNETGIKAVKYSVFVPILIKALQEADDKIDALEARIAELESS